MEWSWVQSRIERAIDEFCTRIKSAVPTVRISRYTLPPETKTFAVGADFATGGRDPDDESELSVFLERATHRVPPDPGYAARYRLPPYEPGSDLIWFFLEHKGEDVGSLDPIVLPPDRDSKEYEDGVREYLQAAELRLIERVDPIVDLLGAS